jgi:hypothetical protein
MFNQSKFVEIFLQTWEQYNITFPTTGDENISEDRVLFILRFNKDSKNLIICI